MQHANLHLRVCFWETQPPTIFKACEHPHPLESLLGALSMKTWQEGGPSSLLIGQSLLAICISVVLKLP